MRFGHVSVLIALGGAALGAQQPSSKLTLEQYLDEKGRRRAHSEGDSR